MKILIVKPDNESVEKYTQKLEAYGIDYEIMNYPIDSKGLLNEDFRTFFAEDMYKVHKEGIDAIQFFSKEWTNPPNKKIKGRMFNKFYSGYLLSYTKLVKGYENTGIHELFHKVDNWVYVYLGIKLENIVGVNDWDEGVVHAEENGYTEYEYEEVWTKVEPYVRQALAAKKHKALLGYLQALLIMLREQLRQMQNTSVIIEEMKNPLADYPLTYRYGVPDEAYALTGVHIGSDYATPINTPLKAPVALEVTVSGYSKSLGNYCHCKYLKAGKTYTTRFLHLKAVPTRGKYQKGAIFAYTGNSGLSSGPHVHVDVWHDEVRLDLINRTNWQQMTVDPEEHFAG